MRRGASEGGVVSLPNECSFSEKKIEDNEIVCDGIGTKVFGIDVLEKRGSVKSSKLSNCIGNLWSRKRSCSVDKINC